MNFKELEFKVKEMYRDVALQPEADYHFEIGRALAERLGYPSSTLDQLPVDAISSFAGVGYHFQLAGISKGEHVVDLGSGSGMDAFLAAKLEFGYPQVHFHQANIEELPLDPESADVVISNGVLNLSPRKMKVFVEAARVLKPGGRFVISDIISSIPLSRHIKSDSNLWAACVGGAMQEGRYINRMENAGLELVEIKTNPYEFLSGSAKGASQDYGIRSISLLAIKK